MKIETYKCVKLSYNSNMGCMECWKSDTFIFYFDRNGWVKVGDTVKCERDEDGFYQRIWVNDILMTEDVK